MTVKRVRTDSPPKSMLLSVSGRKFEVATSTLRKMQWFEPLLAGRFHHPDVFFIDFDPDIFSVILQSVRVHRPPPRQVLNRFGVVDVLHAASYFCVDWLAEILSGKLVNSALPQEIATILAQEGVARKEIDQNLPVESTDLLVDVHKSENVFSEHGVDWGESLLFNKRPHARRRSIPSYDEFLSRMDAFPGVWWRHCRRHQASSLQGAA